ncbi:hypothetical protein [Staphylococcus aureus]|uniref:hypothetical protein n=1 Tax=Staphylococcus aureus TaxID=1280 RepID=UPI001EEFF66F|nr:hypothetical protein [Staphylococcus aureus]
MKKIYVENIGEYILVDDEDFERVNFYKWHKSYAHDTPRFLTQIVGKKTALPVFILNNQRAYQKVKNNDFTRKNLEADKHSFRYRAPQKIVVQNIKVCRMTANIINGLLVSMQRERRNI